MKRIIPILLAIMTLTVSFTAASNAMEKKENAQTCEVQSVTEAFEVQSLPYFMPVPVVTVQTNVLGAPGSTGSYACQGTLVTVSQTNECGQTEIIQQYWVQSSINCFPVVN